MLLYPPPPYKQQDSTILLRVTVLLDEWLTRQGKTTKWLAEQLEVTYQAAHQWRNGIRIPWPEARARIADLTHSKVGHEDFVNARNNRRQILASRVPSVKKS